MRFANLDGRLSVVRGDEVVPIGDLLGQPGQVTPVDERVLIQNFDQLRSNLLEVLKTRSGTRVSSDRFGPPLVSPSKIIAAPTNYRRHIHEMDTPEMRQLGKVEKVHDIERYGLFLKAPSSIIGPNGTIELPFADRRTDHEVELAVVIGRAARNVQRSSAMAYIYGYTIALDITVRGGEERSTRKSFDTFTPLGPVLVTADEIENPHDLGLRLWVNNELRQNARTSDLIWDVPKLIEYASHVMTLMPGDVIITGTPEGVGPICPGDVITAEIDQIGRFSINVGLRDG